MHPTIKILSNSMERGTNNNDYREDNREQYPHKPADHHVHIHNLSLHGEDLNFEGKNRWNYGGPEPQQHYQQNGGKATKGFQMLDNTEHKESYRRPKSQVLDQDDISEMKRRRLYIFPNFKILKIKIKKVGNLAVMLMKHFQRP